MISAADSPQSSFSQILHLDIGDVVTVTRNPVGGASITETCVIERIGHEIGPTSWKTTFLLSPYSQPGSVQTVDGSQSTPGNFNLGW